MRKAAVVVTALSVITFAVACSKRDGDPTGTGPVGSSADPGAKSAAEQPLNATLVGHVKAHAEQCTVSIEQGQAYSCKTGITDAMAKYVRESKPADFASTMIALVRKTDDAKASAAAVALLNEQWDALGEDGKRKNATPDVVKRALEMFKENTANRAVRLAPATAQLATISGSLDDLYAVADAHATKDARDNIYRNLLVFGRLKAFPKLKDVSEKKPEHLSAALDAVPRMFKATPEEIAVICPWAKGHLTNKDLTIATEAAQDMIYCKGEYINALVSEAETRLKNKEFKDPFAQVMREPCFEFISDITKKAAAESQCDAVYAFLEKVVNDSSVDDSTRGLALFNIYYQRRDEKTLKLMRKYENHPNKEVSRRAKEAIQSLTTSYKLKG